MFGLLVDETGGVLAHEELCHVPTCGTYGSYIYGPCEGICYLHDVEEEHAFWNPTTNELKFLPPIITKPNLPSNLRYSGIEACGFGLGLATNDF